MSEPIVVIGVGMMTAVGLTAPETAASVRAATMRFAESDLYDHQFEPFTLAEVFEEALEPTELEEESASPSNDYALRLQRMGVVALTECLAPIDGHGQSPGIVMALPEHRAPTDDRAFLESFHRLLNRRFNLAQSKVIRAGRAGGLEAVQYAARMLQARQASVMIAGGLDSYREQDVLAALDAEKRVKSEVHWDGFVPGEAAGFLLLSTGEGAARLGVESLARLTSCVTGFERGHCYSDEPYLGEGLAVVVQQLVETGEVPSPIREVYSSMNGEHYWAKEWGVTMARNRLAFDPEHGMHHPADCFGDTGAACGPLMVGLAALGQARGYRGSPALVYCSSDRGERAAIAVQAV